MEKLTIGGLDRVQYLLERMLDLTEVSADDSCTDKRWAALQKGFAFLQAEILEILDRTNREDN